MGAVTKSDIKKLKTLIGTFREDASRRLGLLEKEQQALKTEILEDVDRRLDSLEQEQQALKTEIAEDVNHRLDSLEKGQQELKVEIAEIRTQLDTIASSLEKLPDRTEKEEDPNNWQHVGLTLTGAIVGAAIAYFAKTPNS